MHKIVNGKEVELSQSEIESLKVHEEAQAKKWDPKRYINKRRSEYPRVEDCIDAICDQLEMLSSGESSKFTELQKLRKEIKAKYPKS